MARVPHPRCTACGKALYKAKEIGGATTPDMPYKYCRNQLCPTNFSRKPLCEKCGNVVCVCMENALNTELDKLDVDTLKLLKKLLISRLDSE